MIPARDQQCRIVVSFKMTETGQARMPALPGGLTRYHKTPVFTAGSVPDGITGDHSTKPGVWALIQVVRGSLRYEIIERGEVYALTPGRPGVAEPEVTHKVTPDGEAEFFVEFWR